MIDRNDDGFYEEIDDCLYELVDDKPVLQQQENTPVVGGSVDDIAITVVLHMKLLLVSLLMLVN